VPLARGARLGPYEISGLLGAGGMGEVYRARDTRLERTVALKVLPVEFASEPTLRARFEREARAISALEHPHICTLHDVGEEGDQAYLVMEHLEGETLAARLKKGPLPLAQALEVGTQVADALAAAHRHGIVHRDLKPGNVMLTKTGVKLLDFGLARLTGHGERPVVEELTSAPTESAPLTGQGRILGTLPYMAPEQLEGKPADARTDLWALGVVLYEMVAGRRAFEGTSQVSLIGAILEREPVPLATLQPLAPPSLERLVKRCLAKSPEDRWDTAHDVADELRWIVQGGLGPAGAPTARPRRLWALVAGGLAVTFACGVVVGLVGRRVPATPRAGVVRPLFDVSPAEELNAGGVSSTWLPTLGGSRTALAWTPDGRSLVFVGRRGGVQQLYVRDLDAEQARPVEGTEGAQVPVVSPDGRSVAFWAKGAIRRVPLAGGPAAVLVKDVRPIPIGLAWSGDERLFYGGYGDAIWSAEAERAPTAVTTRLEGEVSHVLPHLLPGGQALLYTVRHRVFTWGDEEVVAHVFATGERKALIQDAADARYVPSGHLVFLRRGVLHAVGFDPARLEVRGTPDPVLGGVAQALTSGHDANVTGAGQFSVASTGALAFLRGDVMPYPDAQLVTVDRQGRVSPLDAPARSYAAFLSLSPDGREMAVVIRSLTEWAVWVYDRERGTLTRLPGGGESGLLRWTPAGDRVAFGWLDKGVQHLAWQLADGTAAPEVLARETAELSSWSPDGRQLAFVKFEDIWVATLDGGKAVAAPLATTPEGEQWPEFSPDGRWLALGSNASGRFEVYVQPYPGPGARQLVSLEGGTSPAWNPVGGELFFLSLPDAEGKRHMMVVDVRPGHMLSIGRPRPLFTFSQPPLRLACWPARCFAVARDGQHFYATQRMPTPPASPVTHIQLVLNWTEELKARVPPGPTR
jgi:dipeptidyl aminopeptidase/acylaminoacyl peptidase